MQHACKSWRALSTDPPKGQPTSVTGNHADPNNISSEAGHGQQMVRGSPNQQGQPKTSQADASTDAHSKHEARATSSTTSAPESSQGAKGAMKLSGITEWGVHKLHAKITAALERVQALREHAAAVAAAAAQNQKAAANSIQQASQLGSKDPMGVAAGASEHTGISRPPPSSASASAALSAGHASTSLSQPVSAATAPVASSIPENVMRRVRAGSDMLNEVGVFFSQSLNTLPHSTSHSITQSLHGGWECTHSGERHGAHAQRAHDAVVLLNPSASAPQPGPPNCPQPRACTGADRRVR